MNQKPSIASARPASLIKTLVPCVICERSHNRQPFVNIIEAYPVQIMTNAATNPISPVLKHIGLPAYLCKEHYKEHFDKVEEYGL